MWPRDNQADLIAFYGDPAGGMAANLIKVVPPFRMTYDGTPLAHLMFHRLAAPALERALRTVWEYYGRDQNRIDVLGISKTAGTYNPRFIRGSTTKWSNHAYGAAIDINAEENGFNVEGNIPIPMIAAFKAEGARWGGDYRGRKDPMHFEFCESGEPARTFEQWLAFYGVTSGAAQPPTGDRMRFTGITATVFGGPSDKMSTPQTAYQTPGDWWNRPGVALPARINERPLPHVRVTNRTTGSAYFGKSVDCPVIDVGPWNINDPYWKTGARPQAESGRDMTARKRFTNKAGIDLTPAAAAAIGLQGKGLVDWEFVTVIDGDVLEPLPKPPPPAPAPADAMSPMLLILMLTLLTKENPMTDQPTTGQGQPDLAKILLPLLLQSLISGKPLNTNDLLQILLQGALGVKIALPPPASADPAPPTQPATPGATPQLNDMLLPILLQLLAGGKQTAPQPAAPVAPVVEQPVPAPAPATTDGWTNMKAGLAGVVASLGLSATGVIGAPVGESATTVGMLLPLISIGASALGIPAPIVNIVGTLFSRLFTKPKA